MKSVLVLVVLALAWPVQAQTSANFTLEEYEFNSGGHPAGGSMLSSASFRITFDVLGEPILGVGGASASFLMDSSFCAAYPPPGEVTNLRFTDGTTLAWDAERSAGVYNLYRQTISSLAGLLYGHCEQIDIVGQTTIDNDPPPSGDGYFYLVTVENRIAEEGTKGFDSAYAERPNPAACP